jgi:fluoroquinolone transport system permease protein
MNHLIKLLKWDLLLLNRNKLFALAAVVAAIYIGVFYLIQGLAGLDVMLVVLIFNDPVVTGFLFSAILLLFDKNQNTIQALSVLPIKFEQYLLSKAIILSILATLLAFIMALVILGLGFNPVHLFMGTFFSTFLFCLIGFVAGAYSKNFNQLLAYAVPFMIIAGMPFGPLFGYGKLAWFFFIPSTGGVGLLLAAFTEMPFAEVALMYFYLAAWCFIGWKISVKLILKTLI